MSPDPLSRPVAALGADGSPRSPELVAAAAEGLRWAGCGVVDVGPVTSACFTLALHHLEADGGILAASGEGVGAVGLKFWHGASPLSAGEAMDEIRRLFETGVNRPTRRYGPIYRFPAETSYLAGLSGHYHALRPLGVVVETTSRPLLAYLDTLTAHTACRIIPCRKAPQRLADLIRQEKAHFGVGVDSDAECCQAVDESGRAIPPERLFLLVARHLLAGQPGAAVVLEAGWSESLAQAIAGLGSRVVPSGPRRAEMARQVCGHCAPLGADRSGRIWYYYSEGARRGYCTADALRTITLLLEILSQSDRPLSEVLDAAWPAR
jgi:phosphomannomutase/phosphoglucomutase